ncbi:hypothetical protein EDD21DRAFT_374157 [Dissophora ornata]|nr:hypothetical protein EDD21DRAFT_374157 [Dissophora ornata]
MAGGRYPYPKHVWSPSGGWWTQPTNWKSNTAVAVGISATIVAAAWKYSAENEVLRFVASRRTCAAVFNSWTGILFVVGRAQED